MRKLSSEDMNLIGAWLLVISIGFLIGFSTMTLAHLTAPRLGQVEAGDAP